MKISCPVIAAASSAPTCVVTRFVADEPIPTSAANAAFLATMSSFGPRYLHSTGQLHKGGPNTGLFVLITAKTDNDLSIPGQPFSFGTLELAQALGDFASLGAGAAAGAAVPAGAGDGACGSGACANERSGAAMIAARRVNAVVGFMGVGCMSRVVHAGLGSPW